MKDTAEERSWDAVEVAIEQGKVPWSQTAPGYTRTKDSRLVRDRDKAVIIEQAFLMRADGATIDQIRQFLLRHGVVRSYHGTMHLLRDRIYIGEIHFGSHKPNLTAHEPIIDRELFFTVQEKKIPRGRKAKSDRLLARLGVLRCGTCNSRMVVGTSNNSGYWIYRCPPVGDCPRRVTISAEIAETVVAEEVQRLIWHIKETASAEVGFEEAESALARAQAMLDSYLRIATESGVAGEAAAIERLTKLREARDVARDHYDRLVADLTTASIVISARDWDELDLDEQRGLIKAVVERVVVASSGRGAERVKVEPKGLG